MEEFFRLFVEPVALSIAPRQLLSVERAASDMIERGKQCHTLRLLAAKPFSQKKGLQPSTILKETGSFHEFFCG